MSARRLRALIRGLPTESGFARGVLNAPGPGSWSNAEELAAAAIEVMHSTTRAVVGLSRLFAKEPKPKVPKPIEVPRPASVLGHTRARSSKEELKRFFGAGRVVYTPKE